MKQKYRMTEDMDRGLASLERIARRGKEFSQSEIARACKCSRQNIYVIENNALKAVANILLFQKRHQDIVDGLK